MGFLADSMIVFGISESEVVVEEVEEVRELGDLGDRFSWVLEAPVECSGVFPLLLLAASSLMTSAIISSIDCLLPAQSPSSRLEYPASPRLILCLTLDCWSCWHLGRP